MPRRGEVPKRKPTADPKYKDRLVAKLTNTVMQSGKKAVAEGIVYGAFDVIRDRHKEEPLEVFRKALESEARVPLPIAALYWAAQLSRPVVQVSMLPHATATRTTEQRAVAAHALDLAGHGPGLYRQLLAPLAGT